MPTDNERRDVARRLRHSWANVPDKNPVRHQLRVLFKIYSAVGLADDDDADAIDLFDRLADLIEPNRGSGVRTILCAHCENASWCGCEPGDEEGGCDFEPSVTEGEPPYNLYTLYEAVFHRSPRCWECIEDDEVDELVDALLAKGTKTVVLKGIQRNDGLIRNFVGTHDGAFFEVNNELLPYMLHGTGDLYCSCLLAAVMAGRALDEAVRFAGDFVHDAMIVSSKQPQFQDRGVSFEPLLGKVCALLA